MGLIRQRAELEEVIEDREVVFEKFTLHLGQSADRHPLRFGRIVGRLDIWRVPTKVEIVGMGDGPTAQRTLRMVEDLR